MSEVYNPESESFKQLQALELEARQLAKKRDDAQSDGDRQILDKQLKEVESQVDLLKKKIRP